MNKIQIPWEDRPVGFTHKIQLSDVIIFLHLIVYSIVLLFLLRMVLPAYSAAITKQYK